LPVLLFVLPGIKFNTPINEEQSCAITNFAFKGKDPKHTADYLFEKHKIFTVAYDRAGIKGVRVTPNIHNSIQDLDKLVTAIQIYSKS
jgi:selenocysteine lyase/cysteine desulfurase